MITTLEKGASQANALSSRWALVNKFFKNNFFSDRATDNLAVIPPIDVIEENDNYLIDLAAPGFSKEDFEITTKGNLLSVSYSCSYFSRSAVLPEHADIKKMEPKYINGMLYLVIPKKINVKA
ncbi:MAG: Hsp20/alpha crystallin family protein [Bacteroidia bacterium]